MSSQEVKSDINENALYLLRRLEWHKFESDVHADYYECEICGASCVITYEWQRQHRKEIWTPKHNHGCELESAIKQLETI